MCDMSVEHKVELLCRLFEFSLKMKGQFRDGESPACSVCLEPCQ